MMSMTLAKETSTNSDNYYPSASSPSAPLPPPPVRRVLTPSQPQTQGPSTAPYSFDTQSLSFNSNTNTTSNEKSKKKSEWKEKATQKAFLWSDKIGAKVNKAAVGMGTERIWPTTNDAPHEIAKCTRLVQAFAHQIPEDPLETKKARKPFVKIPASVIRDAKGIAIFSSLRSGIAPFAGAGGAGVVMARLPDGTWSAPSFISPNNLSAGFMLGVDVYDCIFVIRTTEALATFYNHKATLGAEMAIVAGPIGGGAAVEGGLVDGKAKAPLLSYVRSKGLYAGVEVVAQVFVERKEENELFYNWPGISARDILTGTVKIIPQEVATLHAALAEAER